MRVILVNTSSDYCENQMKNENSWSQPLANTRPYYMLAMVLIINVCRPLSKVNYTDVIITGRTLEFREVTSALFGLDCPHPRARSLRSPGCTVASRRAFWRLGSGLVRNHTQNLAVKISSSSPGHVFQFCQGQSYASYSKVRLRWGVAGELCKGFYLTIIY